MIDKINKSSRRFYINQILSTTNPFIKNNEQEILLFKNIKNCFLNIDICFDIINFLNENLYKEIIDNNYLISFYVCSNGKLDYKYKEYFYKFLMIFYKKEINWNWEKNCMYYLTNSGIKKYKYLPTQKLFLVKDLL